MTILVSLLYVAEINLTSFFKFLLYIGSSSYVRTYMHVVELTQYCPLFVYESLYYYYEVYLPVINIL